jgi:hypothetical protein
MPNIIIILDKYSDWLETYSVIASYPEFDNIHCYYIENDRNDSISVRNIYEGITNYSKKIIFHPSLSKQNLFNFLNTRDFLSTISSYDIIAAPFIRYRDIWQIIKKLPINVTTIHLSECLPDTFGHIGYRIGFRGRILKSYLTLPLAKIYAMTHKPDICYFPLYPKIRNPFVKKTFQVKRPPLMNSKAEVLKNITNEIKRPLLISGCGYNMERMAKCLNIEHYIATSKNLEIVVDGKVIPLTERICAEEVLLSGYVSSVTGYSSSAMIWAKFLYPDMPIQCYKATRLDHHFGKFNRYAKRALKKIGIDLKDENREMLD